MAIKTRVLKKPYPGAIVLVEDPFTCVPLPTIQELALELMSEPVSKPSVIMGGRLFTEETKANIEDVHCFVGP